MKLYENMQDVFENPQDYAETDQNIVIGEFDENTYLMIGTDDMKTFYFMWEDDETCQEYHLEGSESYEDLWNKMISDLRDNNQ